MGARRRSFRTLHTGNGSRGTDRRYEQCCERYGGCRNTDGCGAGRRCYATRGCRCCTAPRRGGCISRVGDAVDDGGRGAVFGGGEVVSVELVLEFVEL